MTDQLPEDVIDYLLKMEALQGFPDRSESNLGRLLAKYAPQPKTLADYGPIRWQRTFKLPNQSYDDWSLESMNEGDGLVDVLPEDPDRLVPWPEVEGIDPRELLNNGWQIRCRRDIPEDWDFAWQGDYGINGSSNGTSLQGVPMHAIMFCRPPESDNQ